MTTRDYDEHVRFLVARGIAARLVGFTARRRGSARRQGYTEDELFSTDRHREPKVRENVKVKGRDAGRVNGVKLLRYRMGW